MIDRKAVEEAFAAYAALYDAEDPKIKLKIFHTYRVASLAESIAQSIGMENTDLIWLCGMLHDIGRFEQVKRYGTFSDAASVDHAAFGADLLFKEGLLDKFCTLGAEEKGLLELAIRSHSLYRLPEGLTEEERTYCNILRDADKVDIFRVNVETPTEDIYNVTTYELKHSPISPEVKQCFLDRHAVLRSLKKTPADFLVGHICLTFELVYPKSREAAKEQGFVDRLLAFESDEEDTRNFFSYMRSHVWDQHF
ncbi:MAG: HD domain-containing protein [Lachnospiraceae bacterium]|nr:HD domain-containing protein [Lachnospiraceae bacterium]